MSGTGCPVSGEITSIEELTPFVEDVLHAATIQLTDPGTRETEAEFGFVDIPKAFVGIDAEIEIPGMSRELAMEKVLTGLLGGRDVVKEADAADDVYVVQYLQGATAIMLSKVLNTSEAIVLAYGAMAMGRALWASVSGSTLRVVDEQTEADVCLPPKTLLLRSYMEFERGLEAFAASENKPPLILLTEYFSGRLNGRDQQGLEFLCPMRTGWAFEMREGSTHFLLKTNEADSAFLSELRRRQHVRVAEVL